MLSSLTLSGTGFAVQLQRRKLQAVDGRYVRARQFYANLYGIPVPKGQSDPDIYITLEGLGSAGADKLGLYCNPSWGEYADINANYPQPGYAVWQSGALPPASPAGRCPCV